MLYISATPSPFHPRSLFAIIIIQLKISACGCYLATDLTQAKTLRNVTWHILPSAIKRSELHEISEACVSWTANTLNIVKAACGEHENRGTRVACVSKKWKREEKEEKERRREEGIT